VAVGRLFPAAEWGEQLNTRAFPARSRKLSGQTRKSPDVIITSGKRCPTRIRVSNELEADVPLRLPDGDYLTTQDACTILGLSRTSLYVMRQENRAPPSIRWSRQRLYPRAELIKWFDARVAEATQEEAGE
jgi:predicted DNA-binding transcriptional regulator AlpA